MTIWAILGSLGRIGPLLAFQGYLGRIGPLLAFLGHSEGESLGMGGENISPGLCWAMPRSASAQV